MQNRKVLTKEELKAKIVKHKKKRKMSTLKIYSAHTLFLLIGLGSIFYGNIIGGSSLLLLWLAFILSI